MSNPTVDATDFRNAMARFAAGVTVVTTKDAEGRATGFTASAFSSLSLTPPLVLVCLDKRADCWDAFMAASEFAISILAAGQGDVAMRFATKGIDKFLDAPVTPGAVTGMPLVNGAMVHLECRMWDKPEGGDHTILIGEVLRAASHSDDPLLHFNRSFGRFVAE